MNVRSPIRWLLKWVTWFEERGVYIPEDDTGSFDTWRDFGWPIVIWLAGVGLFILFFALAS